MAPDGAGAPPHLMVEMTRAGLVIPTGEPGLVGRGAALQAVVDGIVLLARRHGADDMAEPMQFPPAIPRRSLERSGYLRSFPHLAGTVHCFCGDERAHRGLLRCLDAGEDWTAGQEASGSAITPASCYPVYPAMAARGALPPGGQVVSIRSYCFRHEPSDEPTRLQWFELFEHVKLGSPDDVVAFRTDWLARGTAMAEELDLPHAIEVANDPFFGRAGTLMSDAQRQQELKFELVVPVNTPGPPTACMSFNYHLDHFGETWGLYQASGEVAHTACVGFGLDRLAFALLRTHGMDPARWPSGVRTALSLA